MNKLINDDYLLARYSPTEKPSMTLYYPWNKTVGIQVPWDLS